MRAHTACPHCGSYEVEFKCEAVWREAAQAWDVTWVYEGEDNHVVGNCVSCYKTVKVLWFEKVAA